jgi:MoaA/NifB/PqqE/SkfB family radical SAM enzyme
VLNTNGMRLDGATAEALVGAGCARVNVSVDGADEAAYGRMRPGGELGLVLANVRRLAEARRRAGSDRPAISLWMVGTTENVRSLPSLARLARVAGADEVYLQRLAFFGRGLATASASVHRSLGGRVLEVVREAAEACRLEGVRLSGSGRLDPGRLDEWAARAAEDWRDCERPWTGLYVAWDGTVHPCCVAPFVGRAPVRGRLPSERPREVWEGERLARFRARVAGARPPACCARCGTDWLL